MSDARPVLLGERFVSLDVLRGVAVLGILVMNIYAFAMPFAAYPNPLLWGGQEPINIGTWYFTHILFDQKFLSIFAMLFGAGLVLMTGRAEARGAKPARIYYRRQFWLVVIGALHAYLIWFGDILFMYAFIGMVAYLFRKRTPRTLIIIACVLLPLALFMNHGFYQYMVQMQAEVADLEALQESGETLTEEQETQLEEWEITRAMMAPTPEDVQKDIDVHRGDYLGIAAQRIPFVVQMQIFGVLFFGLTRVLALMLIGMTLMKLGIVSAERSGQFYRNMMITGYVVGLPLTIYSAIDLGAHDFSQLYVMKWGGTANYFGSLIVGLGHVGLGMWIVKNGYLQRLMRRFADVGRMALTNYLLHSVILTTVFYGYGFGLYGTIPRFWQMGFVVAVIAFQLFFSGWWLSRYGFGPVEWAWRSLTYWKRQPMRSE